MSLPPPVALASPPDAAAWDDLVAEADGATVFHTAAWAGLWTAEWPGAEWRALVISDGARYAAALPIIVRPRPLGRAILSMPFGTYGGPLVRRGHERPPEARRQLLGAYARLGRAPGVLISDLTWYEGKPSELPAGERPDMGSTHVRALASDFDAIFRALPHSVRSRVRQAEEQGVTVSSAAGGEGIRVFHDLASRALGRRGARPKPLSLYDRVGERLVPAGLARYDLAWHEGVAIGGSLHLLHRGVATNWLTVADERHLDLRPNHLLLARVMRVLCEAGFHAYDFGASPPGAGGLVAFKESWGLAPRPVLGLRRRSLVHRLLRG